MTVETLLVDLDDTLYPYPECNEAGTEAAWREARERGYDLDREAFGERYRAARRDVKRDIRETAASHERLLYFKRFVRAYTGTHEAGDALALGEAYWDAYVDAMALFEGVAETLAAVCEAGVDVAVVTNLTTRVQLEKLAHLDLAEHVDLVVTSEETGREKPAGVMFTRPLAALDSRPSEAVMVGNSVENDVAGANAVGVTSVLFNADHDGPAGDPEGLSGRRRPDHYVDSFAAVREVVL